MQFRAKMESHIPLENTRITLPKDSSQSSMFRDGEWGQHALSRCGGQVCVSFADTDSGSDEEFVSREKMKMTAQAVVDAKTKKKPGDDDDVVPAKKRR